MKKFTTIALLALASLGLSGTSALAQSPLSYTAGDLMLGFRASGGTGADKDYVVNIGPAANYSGATGAFSVSGLGNIAADLSSTFGSDWSSRANVFWSVSGTNNNGTTGTVAGEPVRTLFATKAQAIPGILNSVRWQRGSSSSHATPVGKMLDMAAFYAFVNGTSPAQTSTVNSPKGRVQNKSDANSFASYQPGGTIENSGPAPGISFKHFNPTIEGSFGAGTSSILELYRMQPGAGQGDLIGFFSLDDNGTLMFFPASYTGSGGVSGGNATLQFQDASVEVTEGSATASVTIVRGGNLSSALSVTVDTADGSAVSPADYTAISGQVVNFAANEIQKTVSITLGAAQSGFQPDRSFTVALSGAPVGVDVQSPATVTIEDTTPAPVGFASATYSHSPRNALGVDQLTFDVTVVRNNGRGTASATVGNDTGFTAASGHTKLVPPGHFTLTGAGALSFAEGETSKTITVTLLTTTPTPGQFRLALTGVTPALGTATTVVTIQKKDTSKPSLAITSPASTVPSPGTFNLTGTVKDDNASDLGLFEVTLNGAPVTVTRGAYVANTAVGFSANGLQAENGPNTIVVTARDAHGNVTIATKTFTYINTTLGTATVGTYNGVLVPSGTATNDTSGFVTITVTSTAAFSGKVTLSGIAVSVSGVLSNAGNARFKPVLGSTYDLIDKTEFESYLGAFSFNVSGGQATGTLLTSAGGSAIATFIADKNFYDGLTPATTVQAGSGLLNLTTKGVYNIALPSEAQVPVLATSLYPQGDGVGTITLTPNGVVAMKGNLADGTAFSASGRLAEDLSVALYANLYKKRGSLAGYVSFDLLATDSDVSGANLLWIRPAQPRARYYPAGWENGVKVDVVGTQFNPVDVDFGQGADLLTTGNASLVFADGLLSGPVTKGVNVATSNGKVTLIPSSATDYKLSLSATSGLFSGYFTHSDLTKPAFKGALLNKGANKGGFGYFLSTPPATYGGSGQGGGVSLQP